MLVNLDGDPNMPAGFKLMVNNDSADFSDKYESFKLARQTIIDTNKKVMANNACFKQICWYVMTGKGWLQRVMTQPV